MRIITLLPLSSTVVAVETESGWRLSDGHRWTVPYPRWEDALEDADTKRRLTYEEDLPNQEDTIR